MESTGFTQTAIHTEIEGLRKQLARWADDQLSDYEVVTLIKRSGRKLLTACWCQSGVCCRIHQTHVSPHQNCILR